MRTRSQPASPGGFVSLETGQSTTRRVTRSARSASRAASQESSTQQATEPSTEAAARPRSQRKIKKPVSRKTAATTISTSSDTASSTAPATSATTTSTTATTKTQTRKAPKRGTRKTTRKAQQATPEETDSNAETIIESTGKNEDRAAEGAEDSKSDKSDKALLEPKSSSCKNLSHSLCHAPLPLTPVLNSSALSPPFFLPSPPSPPPSQAQELASDPEFDFGDFLACQEAEVLFNPQFLDAVEDLYLSLPDLGDSVGPAWYELNPDELDSLEYAVSEHTDSPEHRSWLLDLQLDDSTLAQLNESLAMRHAAVERTIAQPVQSTSVQVTSTEPTTAEAPKPAKPIQSEQSTDTVAICEKSIELQKTVSPLASAVDSNEQTTVEDTSFTATIDLLAKSFAGLSLFDLPHCSSKEAVVSSESTTTPVRLPETKPAPQITTSEPALVSGVSVAAAAPLSSSFDEPEPSIPSFSLFAPPKRVPLPPRTIFTPIPETRSSIFDDSESAQQQLAPVVSVESSDLIPDPPIRRAQVPPRTPQVSRRKCRLTRYQWKLRKYVEQPRLLSPILEKGEVDLGACTGVGHHKSPDWMAPTSPTPIVSLATSYPLSPASASASSAPFVSPACPALSISTAGTPLKAIPTTVPLDLPLSSPFMCLENTTKKKVSIQPNATRTKEIQSKATRTSARIRDKQPKKKNPNDTKQNIKNSKKESLTAIKVNRKRAHSQASPENDAGPSTPSTNKRRNISAPGSTPFRRATLPRRLPNIPVSYSERQLRRREESEGRIVRTIFRLPKLVAQNEADRLAAESSAPASPSPGPLQVNPEFSVEQTQDNDEAVLEQSATAQEPSTPVSTNTRWNIRGLLNSVPRSFSRFIPLFARTPERSEALAPQQPSSERVQHTETVSADAPMRGSQSRRRLSEQLPAQRPRNLSYSLFPAPIDRSLYLGDITTNTSSGAPATAPEPQPEHETPDRLELHQSATPIVPERGRDRTPHATPGANESQKKKRKRSPSPDVIPNPVGSSYGMDLDYFCYSSESEDEDTDIPVPQTEPKMPDSLAKTALHSSAQTERPASKKVRFDASPEDTPSRRRARATDPYTGIHFVGVGNPQPSSAPTTPTPATPAQRIVDPTQRPGFIPNRSGTFQLDYDAFSDDSDSSGAPSPPGTPAPASVIQAPTFMQPITSESAQPSTPRPTIRAGQTTSTPGKIDEEALARARSQAEKYKPKTPSGLRTASRYSSPLTAPTPDSTPAPAVETTAEQFGNDQFAQDAQWLYEHCPSGDLSRLAWPQPTSLAQTLGISDEAVHIVDEVWDESQIDEYLPIFQQGVEELRQTLAL
ncbi:hypothetical protein BJY01DRAFT_10292 [Aspergillus pseudoustus]|uniref:Uncharacterized protein n=1 Tax=Aspergillus pseudoustus TaxID=1810923 RepID=A0ABR4KSS5_9EURO